RAKCSLVPRFSIVCPPKELVLLRFPVEATTAILVGAVLGTSDHGALAVLGETRPCRPPFDDWRPSPEFFWRFDLVPTGRVTEEATMTLICSHPLIAEAQFADHAPHVGRERRYMPP